MSKRSAGTEMWIPILATLLFVLVALWATRSRSDIEVHWGHEDPASVAGWVVVVGAVEVQVVGVDPGPDGTWHMMVAAPPGNWSVKVLAVGHDGLVSEPSNVLEKKSTRIPCAALDLNKDGIVGGPDFGLWLEARGACWGFRIAP